ncbi:NinE family protein [Shimwellia blattae]
MASVIERNIFRVRARRKARPELNPSQIPTFNYSAHLADVRWLRHAARRKNHG